MLPIVADSFRRFTLNGNMKNSTVIRVRRYLLLTLLSIFY